MFIPYLGIVHLFDWDEINFAEISREMIVSGNYARVQVDFLPFWQKPPLFFWLQVVAMHTFGINEFAARFPNALTGIATILILFYIGNKFYNQNFGLLWVLAYLGSFLPHFYFKSGIIDPLFNLFIFLSVYQLANLTSTQESKQRNWAAIWGGVFMGLAILTKGPVALLIVGLCGLIYWLWSRRWGTFKIVELLVYAFLSFVVSSLWYLPETLQNGFWFINEFLEYQLGLATISADTAHEQPFWYHPVVLLVGCFPASIYFLVSFKKSKVDNTEQKNFKNWMKLLFWVTLILFSIVKAKIIHYSSLCYFPLTYLAVDYIYKVWQREFQYSKWLNVLFLAISIIVSLLLIALPFIDSFKESLIPYIKDPFAVASLRAEVYWSGWEILIGLILLVATIYAIFGANRKSVLQGAIWLFFACILVLQASIYVFIPKIERYSQGAAIDFFESVQDEDAYKTTLRYHSYAQLFYGRTSAEDAATRAAFLEDYFGKNSLEKETYGQQRYQWNDWLMHGDIDKPAYFVTRLGRDKFQNEKNLQKLGEKNGFIFYKRSLPPSKAN